MMIKDISLILLLFSITILTLYLIRLNKETFKNQKNKNMCIFRILGNNLNSVHSNTQTFDNLKFTLENETDFENCDKIWILNRIVNKNLQIKYQKLLDKYNKKYLIIPFNRYEYNKIKNKYNVNLDNLQNRYDIFRKLYYHSLYLININGSKNYSLNYGKQRYLYSLVLDGNCFFTDEQFNKIINNLKTDTEYIILPLIRLDKNNLNIDLSKHSKEEPQIGFKNTSKIMFNEKLCYGLSNKAELLRVLNIKGKWENWQDNKHVLNIPDRPKQKANTQIISSVCRLSNGTNQKKKSPDQRANGLLQLVKDVN